MAASDEAADDGSPVTGFVGADIATPVGGGVVRRSEDDVDESEEDVEDGLEDEGVVEVVRGIVVDFSAGVGVCVGVGVGVGVFVNDVGDANKWSVLGVFAQAI